MPDTHSQPSAAGAVAQGMPIRSSATGVASFSILLAITAALGLTFWLYAQPDLMVILAEQLWACF